MLGKIYNMYLKKLTYVIFVKLYFNYELIYLINDIIFFLCIHLIYLFLVKCVFQHNENTYKD